MIEIVGCQGYDMLKANPKGVLARLICHLNSVLPLGLSGLGHFTEIFKF